MSNMEDNLLSGYTTLKDPGMASTVIVKKLRGMSKD
jgi:hypothetical protein